MKPLLISILFSLITLTVIPVKADILLLVHGYLGSPGSWESSGVVSILHQNGWHRAGLVCNSPRGVIVKPGPGFKADKKIFLLKLPNAAPLAIQRNHYLNALTHLKKQHPNEKFTIVGHSVGGVVARLSLLHPQAPEIDTLITIASPHLGTPRAGQGLDYADDSGPFGIVKNFFGGDTLDMVQYSSALLVDILPATPGSLLFHLNHQPHPDIRYISIIRGHPLAPTGDFLVPGISQDMNRIPALAGKVLTYPSNGPHTLFPGDGFLLLKILDDLKNKSKS
ncbi:esterase/lipase family protein [Magnetococcales bacterium HHB-1]